MRGILRGKIHRTMAVWPAATQALSSLPDEQRLCDVQEVTSPGAAVCLGAAGQVACCEVRVCRGALSAVASGDDAWRIAVVGDIAGNRAEFECHRAAGAGEDAAAFADRHWYSIHPAATPYASQVASMAKSEASLRPAGPDESCVAVSDVAPLVGGEPYP